MAHPTRRFFCFRDNDEYKMIPCYWSAYPRPLDMQGSHPYYEEESNKVSIRFAEELHSQLERNFDRVVMENSYRTRLYF